MNKKKFSCDEKFSENYLVHVLKSFQMCFSIVLTGILLVVQMAVKAFKNLKEKIYWIYSFARTLVHTLLYTVIPICVMAYLIHWVHKKNDAFIYLLVKHLQLFEVEANGEKDVQDSGVDQKTYHYGADVETFRYGAELDAFQFGSSCSLF
ncbi:uncharacterized protein LOC111518358 [Drosophila willistoni]|uniref:uncharacterized protein LOC111518358 n=1 Tax=Drosophila willistoni TaxID=7260 RepID=UPI001F071594|nr:uncharacterized protein LOC111518358 [Drosophila willistoni]